MEEPDLSNLEDNVPVQTGIFGSSLEFKPPVQVQTQYQVTLARLKSMTKQPDSGNDGFASKKVGMV